MNGSFNFSISGKCTDNGLERANLKSLNTAAYFRENAYKAKITDIAFIYNKDFALCLKDYYNVLQIFSSAKYKYR